MTVITLDERQLATVLAALRHWQATPSEHTMDLNAIATNEDEFAALDLEEIDELCEEINCADSGQAVQS